MVKTIQLYGFSSSESPAAVTEFLEAYTGKGTVHAIKFLPPKDGKSRTLAIVQFTDAKFAGIIIPLADARSLWYNKSYLKARKAKFDMVPNSEIFEHCMELAQLHLGCQISEEQFSVLWTALDVSVKFGKEFKNIYLLLSLDAVEYKLEISSESIRQIELHHPRGQLPNFLLIQLLGAPRIFKKASQNGWVREVDFTPSRCIGQSSVVCLELPPTCELPNLRKIYAHYKENEGQLVLERGNTFSCTSDLVPIVGPPLGINLPYKILFKINSLVQHGCVPGQALDVKFYELVDPSIIRIEYIECALDKLFRLKGCCYEPVSWLTEQYREYMACKRIPQSPAISLDDGMVYVHRVQVTPSKVYFCGPEANVSNRVLRNYPEDVDNFLRVSFVDEDMGKMRSGDLCPRTNSTTSTEEERRTGVYERILSTLRNGIVIGEKKFEFLAHSSSQLREHSVWMFASRSELTAQDIRNWMGDFSDIKNVAKHAARLGQAFSSSRETFDVGEDEIEFIPDVKTERGGVKYCFSDGIGKISAEFAGRVASKCGKSTTPSAFQIRLGGYKGVVAVDPTLSKKLALRDSMCKYQSNNTKLDVLAWSRYQPCFLNRQLITLLSTLGVPDLVFVKKQNEALKQLEGVLADPSRALEALEMIFQGEVTDVLKEMLACGYEPDAEPFLSLMLQAFCASKLVELRTKTRIFVPNGRSLMGCLDETGTLEYGQVFVQCSQRVVFGGNSNSSATSSKDNFIVEGNVVVAKNPCLHPGDVRVLWAVNVPALHHMVDCVVFPQKGNRPHPNECSGSDLDGDFYFVSWDPDLIPPRQVRPMKYIPAPTIELGHDVTMEEVAESFTNYIVNDNLGIICNAHTVFADRERQKATSAPCIKLAKLSSHAVDSPKTGVVVEVPHCLRVDKYPDFMEKGDKLTYESKRVIGRLFRQVKHVELASDSPSNSGSIKSFTMEVAMKFYDPDMEVDGFEDYIKDAINYKIEYDYKLGNLMDYYGYKTEAEILSGSITAVSKNFNWGKDLESIHYAIKALRKEARTWFDEKLGMQSDMKPDINDVQAAKASAWYHVTYHPDYWGRCNKGMERDHFLSFPWCVFDKLIQIKRRNSSLK
ncbi:PREDICTED: RNA-dependent [Prunus dulcis]|uniref:RNA-dependent RNA polymerase n=1 Tax=Prunus dulcis TaxID=3755 RepID=A0A5E4EG47_PRUDU|nr:probable RNA-dependent RNA polymerase 1 [Prunus dulcis]XP_034200065.1 probable RNA-dependent RNA polymerase 1 [Prunus dulcis]VVA14604.1 PREDICTED: RNA-dependent [Prunus dulcis]